MRIEEIEEWRKRVEDHLGVEIKEKREFPPKIFPGKKKQCSNFWPATLTTLCLSPMLL